MAKSISKKGPLADQEAVLEQGFSSVDWREAMLAQVRQLILQAEPDMEEERKWKKPTKPQGVPVWSRGGIVCTGETYKQVVKLTFAKGAALPDPRGLFNSSLEGNTRRAIDIREGEQLDPQAFQQLIRAAVTANLAKGQKTKPPQKMADPKTGTASGTAKKSGKTVYLSGGNPQIAKGEGDAPVQAYLDALPGWKKDLCIRLDALIRKTVPNLRKAVKWNSPFYGVPEKGWFLSFHVFTRYVKVTFFKGQELRPVPPGGTERSKEARWVDLQENAPVDDALLAKWIRQAASRPGWMAG